MNLLRRFAINTFLLLLATYSLSAQNTKNATQQSDESDLIIPAKGDPIKAYNLYEATDCVFYQESNKKDAPYRKMDLSDIVFIRKAEGNGNVNTSNTTNISNTTNTTNISKAQTKSVQTPKTSNQVVPIEQAKWNVLDKGKSVYCIPSQKNNDYEDAGIEAIKSKLYDWGYYKVVDDPESAHFFISYEVNTEGRDVAVFKVMSRFRYKKDWTFLTAVVYDNTTENLDENEKLATKFITQFINGITTAVNDNSSFLYTGSTYPSDASLKELARGTIGWGGYEILKDGETSKLDIQQKRSVYVFYKNKSGLSAYTANKKWGILFSFNDKQDFIRSRLTEYIINSDDIVIFRSILYRNGEPDYGISKTKRITDNSKFWVDITAGQLANTKATLDLTENSVGLIYGVTGYLGFMTDEELSEYKSKYGLVTVDLTK